MTYVSGLKDGHAFHGDMVRPFAFCFLLSGIFGPRSGEFLCES